MCSFPFLAPLLCFLTASSLSHVFQLLMHLHANHLENGPANLKRARRCYCREWLLGRKLSTFRGIAILSLQRKSHCTLKTNNFLPLGNISSKLHGKNPSVHCRQFWCVLYSMNLIGMRYKPGLLAPLCTETVLQHLQYSLITVQHQRSVMDDKQPCKKGCSPLLIEEA